MWVVGQRVLSQSEPELGVGLVVKVRDTTSLDVIFEGSEAARRYSAKNAPLRRLQIEPGQRVRGKEGQQFRVTSVDERDGLFRYQGEGQALWEYELDAKVQDLGVVDQFLLGQWTAPAAFDLRDEAWRLRSQSLSSRTRGLVGPRLGLMPHQLYIAQELSHREAPRALLADEVGLGKTIEAGLIFSSLRALDRAERVLVLTPQSLKHQWLAEFYRRFHALFSVAEEDSPPLSEFDWLIASLDLVLATPERQREILEESWDLVIVDEAHHLKWSPRAPSAAWELVKELGSRTSALLLLTATPRQQGLESQFGLLNIVDPERFANFEEFASEAAVMKEVAGWARALEAESSESAAQKALAALRQRFADDEGLVQLIDSRDRAAVLDALVDRHGTGRVLFRNRRERLQGFPRRRLKSHPLGEGEEKEAWLKKFLAELGEDKVLLLCSSLAEVKRLDAFFQKHSGVRRALFHEELDLVERDRQAAWFAQPRGAQILISSEVGGEGRNFQFCHRLLLYDLPPQPDLLEQRIGRLDRIGQGQEIEIIVPWRQGTSEEVFFRWYQEGLNCFEKSWSGLARLEETFHHEIEKCLRLFDQSPGPSPEKERALSKLIAKTQLEAKAFQRELEESTDHLIDLNSYRPARGQAIKAEIEAQEADPLLAGHMEKVWNFFGVEQEDFDERGSVKLVPGSLMFVQSFPELEDEKVVTFSRRLALEREDFVFLSADHPMVEGSLSLLLDQGQGAASAAVATGPRPGAYFEFLFVLQAVAPASLEVGRFLRPELLRISCDQNGEWQRERPHQSQGLKPLPEAMIRPMIAKVKTLLPRFAMAGEARLKARLDERKRAARQSAEKALSAEESRLRSLRALFASVPRVEIEALVQKRGEILEAIDQATLRLDALRLVMVSEPRNASSRE